MKQKILIFFLLIFSISQAQVTQAWVYFTTPYNAKTNQSILTRDENITLIKNQQNITVKLAPKGLDAIFVEGNKDAVINLAKLPTVANVVISESSDSGNTVITNKGFVIPYSSDKSSYNGNLPRIAPFFSEQQFFSSLPEDDNTIQNPDNTLPDSMLPKGIDNSNYESVMMALLNANKKNSNVNVSIYPNPTTDYFKVDFPKDVKQMKVEIYNILGTQVMSKTMTPRNNWVDISSLDKGIYLARFSTNNNIKKILKIVKK
ncbi:T9SS type A sorting domain-containing protein [Zhouia sp. PK063]|uniref:T9SS type A sorting domain-containing protein n=1 Tax=Zhouia sp. PK063 TaxID=3373602 RepID=UPI0037941B39